MPFSVIATVTDQGRQRMAEMLKSGKSYEVNQFSVSDGGHNTGNPLVAIAPNPSSIICPTNGFTFGPTAINASALVSAFCPQFTCVLNQGDANAGLSSICLHAEIVYSPTLDDPDVGESFLFAIANFPLKVKTAQDVFTFNVLVQF